MPKVKLSSFNIPSSNNLFSSPMSVVGIFLRHGPKEFKRICVSEIKMRENHASDLLSALETKLNALFLQGSDKEDLKKLEPDGEHSAR